MFSIKGARTIEQYKIIYNWLNDNFADGSVRAVFTEENHAKIIDKEGSLMPVEIQDGRVIDYNVYYSQKAEELENMIAEAVDQHKKAVDDVSQTYRQNDFQSLNSKFDSALQSGDTVIGLKNERTNLRLEKLRKTQWDMFLGNDNWIPMEQPRQLSSEYFDSLDIKVVLQYQLDAEVIQEMAEESSCMERKVNGVPDRFYLGKVNGKIELIAGENYMDHELFHFSSEATNSYELSCSTLKEIAGKIYDYDDVVVLTVDEQRLNHVSKQTVLNDLTDLSNDTAERNIKAIEEEQKILEHRTQIENKAVKLMSELKYQEANELLATLDDAEKQWDTAIEEAMKVAEIPEPDFGIEM